MRYSGIGGQAVMEGVMMKNGKDYAVAVRLNDGSIHVDKKKMKTDGSKVNRIPIIRGIYAFGASLVIGLSTLMDSASYFEEEDAAAKEMDEKKKKRKENVEMAATLAFSVVLAMVLFMILPFYISKLFGLLTTSNIAIAAIEGLVRVVIFLVYILAIGRMEDIKRVYMYHGAEHKCINCIEHGMELTVENVRKSSRFHKRCGTSFVFVVLVISIFVFMFLQADSRAMQLLYRLLLLA